LVSIPKEEEPRTPCVNLPGSSRVPTRAQLSLFAVGTAVSTTTFEPVSIIVGLGHVVWRV